MNVVATHPFESLLLDEWPELCKGAVNHNWILVWVSDFGEQMVGLHAFHRVTLGGPNKDMVLSLLDLESGLVVVSYNSPYALLVDVFKSLSPQESHQCP